MNHDAERRRTTAKRIIALADTVKHLYDRQTPHEREDLIREVYLRAGELARPEMLKALVARG